MPPQQINCTHMICSQLVCDMLSHVCSHTESLNAHSATGSPSRTSQSRLLPLLGGVRNGVCSAPSGSNQLAFDTRMEPEDVLLSVATALGIVRPRLAAESLAAAVNKPRNSKTSLCVNYMSTMGVCLKVGELQ
jgi:hypothetical protein